MNDARSATAQGALDDAVSGSENTLGEGALDDPRSWESDEPVTEPMSIEALLERRERVSARKDTLSFAAGQAEPSTRALTLPMKFAPSEAAAPAKLGPWAGFRRNFEQTSLPRKASAALIIGLVVVSLVNARRRAPDAHSAARRASSQSVEARESTAVIEKKDLSNTEGSLVAGAEPGTSDGQKGGPTLQREAADAVLAGDLQRALALYRRLSAADPHASVYQEAARVIEARLEKARRTP